MQTIALYVSFFMAIYLFIIAYIEGIKIANAEGKVHGGTFILSITFAFVFSYFTYQF